MTSREIYALIVMLLIWIAYIIEYNKRLKLEKLVKIIENENDKLATENQKMIVELLNK